MSVMLLSNGQTELHMTPNDLQYIGEKHLGFEYGNELAKVIYAQSENEIYAQAALNTDLDSYEGTIEEYRDAMQEVVELSEKFQEWLEDTKRIDREKLNSFIENILTILGNEL